MERTNHILLSVILSIALIGFGSIGYMIIEGWNFMDALYMTIITVATVGYGEVQPVGMNGRVFTVLLIFLGGGCYLYIIGNVIQFLVEGQIRVVLGRRKLDHQINHLQNHYILCGYGRIGRVLARYLIQKYIDVVVIERSESRANHLNEDGILYLIGEATDEEVLKKAGIQRAKGLITAVATDADNVFLVLIAKELNPNLFVIARASQNSAKKTLSAAGANKVISPYDLGARRMAHAILRPTVIKFLETAFSDDKTDIELEEFSVRPESKLVGVALMDSGIRQHLDLIILVINKHNGKMLFNPKADTKFEAGDTVVAVGAARSLYHFSRLLSGYDVRFKGEASQGMM
jgi:voltage-gated potassium channel